MDSQTLGQLMKMGSKVQKMLELPGRIGRAVSGKSGEA